MFEIILAKIWKNFEKVTIIIFQRSASKEEEMALLQHAEFKEAFDEFDKLS